MAVQVAGSGGVPIGAAGIMLRLLTIGALIVLNAFFVAAEFSIVSVRRSRINQLASVGDVQAQTVQSLQRSIDRLLPTTQIGITLASLALGWIGEDTLALLLHHWLRQLPIPVSVVSHGIALMVAFCNPTSLSKPWVDRFNSHTTGENKRATVRLTGPSNRDVCSE